VIEPQHQFAPLNAFVHSHAAQGSGMHRRKAKQRAFSSFAYGSRAVPAVVA
jgi:hypothetical protein